MNVTLSKTPKKCNICNIYKFAPVDSYKWHTAKTAILCAICAVHFFA